MKIKDTSPEFAGVVNIFCILKSLFLWPTRTGYRDHRNVETTEATRRTVVVKRIN
jgi:hypothetical protein